MKAKEKDQVNLALTDPIVGHITQWGLNHQCGFINTYLRWILENEMLSKAKIWMNEYQTLILAIIIIIIFDKNSYWDIDPVKMFPHDI